MRQECVQFFRARDRNDCIFHAVDYQDRDLDVLPPFVRIQLIDMLRTEKVYAQAWVADVGNDPSQTPVCRRGIFRIIDMVPRFWVKRKQEGQESKNGNEYAGERQPPGPRCTVGRAQKDGRRELFRRLSY